MGTTVYPSLEEQLYLHRRMIERFGGEVGACDLGLLESVLARPRSEYYASLSEQAAALLQSLVTTAVFADSNTSSAIAGTLVFLRLNGYRLVVDPEEGERFVNDEIVDKDVELDRIVKWIEAHMEALSSTPEP